MQTATVEGELPQDVSGWDTAQLENAAIIVQAGHDLGFGARDRAIAVMTAMGESSLTVLDHGDDAGPDSRGLFQQRDGWGPLEVRMDAYGSSVLFYQALGEVDDRDDLEPTIVAHTVQINADPYHYEPYWVDALAVVTTLTDYDYDVIVEPVEASGDASPSPGALASWSPMSLSPMTEPTMPARKSTVHHENGWVPVSIAHATVSAAPTPVHTA